jgi:hopanoid biosynthesis associated RND transporter like protein HpnN
VKPDGGRLGAAMTALVELSRRFAGWVVLAALALSAISGLFAATHFGIDSDVSAMISPKLGWRQREIHLAHAFPQNDNLLLVVVDGATADLADQAADRLAAALAARPAQFRNVRRPDAGPYFDKEGLLFLPEAELQAMADQLIAAQPMIASLAADPSLRGLFGALGLALQGVADGQATLADLEPALAAVADAAETVLAGKPRPLSWQRLFTGRAPLPRELRRFVLVNPVLDYGELSPGSGASAAVRQTAAGLGLTPDAGVRVRLTGPVALSDDQFASAAQGTGKAALLSVVLVCIILLLALRSLRTVVAVLLTLLAGLLATAAFALLSVGDLNVISVAFVVLFVGIAVDFSIQLCVRYRDETFRLGDRGLALAGTARQVAPPLLMAALTSAVGFYCFVPTDYRGIAELGIIAGTGMVIAILLNFTLLPALLALLRPSPAREPVGFRGAAPVDHFLIRRRRPVVAAGGVLALLGLALLPRLHFDFDPMHLQNQHAESVSTLIDMIEDESSTPYRIEVLAPSVAAAADLARRISALPEAGEVVTVSSFVPEDQEPKLAILADLQQLLDPSLHPPERRPPPDDAAVAAATTALIERLRAAAAPGTSAGRLADDLAAIMAGGPAARSGLARVLVEGLAERLDKLATALSAGKVTLADLPADLKRDWVAPDGRARVEVSPKGRVRSNDEIRRFVDAVRAVAPEATGGPVGIVESGRTIVHAFVTAGLIAFVGVALLLFIVLSRVRDVALVFAPVLLAALLTVSTSVLLGLPINYANIIALPLLLGIGVAFSIYFVSNWRAGQGQPLQSSTARAVLFSALTTMTAFGSLGLSRHPGTADMGKLLTIALGYTLLATFFFLPALLGPPPRPR